MIILVHAAYRRRRGWMAWTVARLVTMDHSRNGFPPIEKLTGEVRQTGVAQSPVQIAHNIRLWKAALNRGVA